MEAGTERGRRRQEEGEKMKGINLILSNDVVEIRELVAQGFCPIECSIGGDSIVDDLKMDHHGSYSHLEAVSVRAYRDHFGARSSDARFVTTGVADADCCFAAVALAGLLPHPNREVPEKTPPPVKASLTRDLIKLAETVGRVDVSPIGLNIPELPFGELLLTWNAMTAVTGRSNLGFYQGVGLWQSLTEGNPAQLNPFLRAAKEAEENRVAESLKDFDRAVDIDGVLLIKGSRVFGFPEWYGRVESEPFESLKGWKHPVVMAHLERGRNITLGCPNNSVAEELFGKGGLMAVFPHLQPAGWGGRESVCGSPRGVELTDEQADEAARVVSSLIKR